MRITFWVGSLATLGIATVLLAMLVMRSAFEVAALWALTYAFYFGVVTFPSLRLSDTVRVMGDFIEFRTVLGLTRSVRRDDIVDTTLRPRNFWRHGDRRLDVRLRDGALIRITGKIGDFDELVRELTEVTRDGVDRARPAIE